MNEEEENKLKILEAQIETLKKAKVDLDEESGKITKKLAALEVYKEANNKRIAISLGMAFIILASAATDILKFVFTGLGFGVLAVFLYKNHNHMSYLAETYHLPVKKFKIDIEK